MLKKLCAPVLFTSILVIAGCSSDEASKDLENGDEIKIDKEDQKSQEKDTSKEEKQDTQKSDASEDQTSDENGSSDNSSNEQKEQDSTQEQSSEATKEDQSTEEQQGSQTGSSGSGGSDQETKETSSSNNSTETTQASSQQTFTFKEVNGEAVKVIEGINAVEIKRENISGAKATSAVAIKAGGKQINLSYNKERDSFRNYQIKEVELEQLKQATVIIQG